MTVGGVRVVVEQRDRAGGVAGEGDHLEVAPADRDPVALGDPASDGDAGLLGDGVGVRCAGEDLGPGGPDDVGQRPVVVPVLVGGDDGAQAGVADERQQLLRLGRGVDEHLVAGLAGSAAGRRCWTSARPRPAW